MYRGKGSFFSAESSDISGRSGNGIFDITGSVGYVEIRILVLIFKQLFILIVIFIKTCFVLIIVKGIAKIIFHKNLRTKFIIFHNIQNEYFVFLQSINNMSYTLYAT